LVVKRRSALSSSMDAEAPIAESPDIGIKEGQAFASTSQMESYAQRGTESSKPNIDETVESWQHTVLENRLPSWWKTELRGKCLPDIWPYNDGKMLYLRLGAEACEELSNWWDQRNERNRNGLPKFPKNCVAQLEHYFSSSHGSVRQVIMAWRRDHRGGITTEASKGDYKFELEDSSPCLDGVCAANTNGDCDDSREKRNYDDQEEIIEKIRTLMLKIVSSLKREAFRGNWRVQWLKGGMLETERKIESGSLKEMCRVILKVELEMNWNAVSDEFRNHRKRVLGVWRGCFAACPVYRELLFFSRQLNPQILQDECELLSEATHENLTLDELSCQIKGELETVTSLSVNRNICAPQQGLLDAKSQLQGLPSHNGGNNFTSYEEKEVRKEFEGGPDRSSNHDSMLVWALYRKKEWWPAQVIPFSDCE
jgi:hypothetical protein